MAQNALASGSVVLTANADQMTKGLAEAEKKAEQSFHKTESKLNKATQKYLKHEGGFLGAVGGGVLSDVGLAGATAGIIGVGLAVKQVAKAFDDSAEQLKKWEKKLEGMSKLVDRNLAHTAEWREVMIDPLDKRISVERDIVDLQRKRADHLATVAAAEAKIADVRKLTPVGAASRVLSFAGLIEDPRDIPKAIRDKSLAEVEKLNEKLAALMETRARIMDKEKDPAFVGMISKATLALQDQATAWGLAGDEATRALFKAHGATETMMKDFDAAAKKVRDLAEAERLSAIETERFFKSRSTAPLLGMVGAIVGAAKPSDWTWQEKGSGRFGMLGSMLAMGVNAAGDALKPVLAHAKDSQRTLAGAVEAGTKEGYSLSAKNQFGVETSQKLVDIKNAITDGTKQMTDILRAIGIVI